MASSSQKKVSGNLTGKELVPVKMEIDDQALCLAIEHPPVNISLIKNSRPDTRSRAPEAPNLISFKLPKKYYENLFVSAEHRAEEGGLRNIFWSPPVDFSLPENSMNQIMKRDEDVKSTYGVGPLPLAERLGGWKIENRQRPRLERYDKFFYHKSGGQFRTFPDVVRFINHASLPSRRKKALNHDVLALEAPKSEPSQAARDGAKKSTTQGRLWVTTSTNPSLTPSQEAASLKRKRPLPISIGSTKENEKTGDKFFGGAKHNRSTYGTIIKGLQTSAKALNQGALALEAPGSEPSQAASLKRKSSLPLSIGSTKENEKTSDKFFRGAQHNRLTYGTESKGLLSSTKALNQGIMGLEALGSEPPQAASLKSKRSLPPSIGSTKENEKTGDKFSRGAHHNQLSYGTENKSLLSSANYWMDHRLPNSTNDSISGILSAFVGGYTSKSSLQACYTIQMVEECLESDKRRRAEKKLQQYFSVMHKGREILSPGEVTPRMTPERGSECLRRFNNEECIMPQGNQEDMRNEEGLCITRLREQEIKVETIIPDLFIPDEDLCGLEDFL